MELKTLTILPGKNKFGEDENFEKIELKPGDIVSIVGPTGSGKSQLLYDIEVLARGDTISKRKVLLNGEIVPREVVSDPKFTIIGHVSQKLKFFIDMTVEKFIEYHAKILEKEVSLDEVLEIANKLTGEKITPEMRLHELSGGQSRALMIADILIIRDSPVLLADEIENAGIDKVSAVELFTSKKDRVVIFVTHDPVLALSSDFRIVLRKGGIEKIIKTTEKEIEYLNKIKNYEREYYEIREKIRRGETIA